MSYLHNMSRYQKSISWVLIATVFALLLLPVQIHIHHDLESVSHDNHTIDYHMMMDGVVGADHFSHGDTHIIETSTNYMVKQAADNLFKVVALVILFLLLPLQTFSYRQRYFHSLLFHYQKYYSLSPPLRAPPL